MGKEVTYFGESGRTSYDRGLEHLRSIQNGDTGHACAKHHLECHQGEPWNFTMKVVRGHKYPLQRQTFEGRLIADFKGTENLNQKGGWGCTLPPTLSTGDDNV